MRRASLASLLSAALLAAPTAAPAAAVAPAAGFGKGGDYCGEYGSHTSAYSFDGVYACASTESRGPTPFDSDGKKSFQCIELVARFLWAVYGIWAGPETGVPDGAHLVSFVHRRYPSIRVSVPAANSVPVAGDVVSLGPGGAVDRRYGHTAIVVSDDPRHGRFRILGENFPSGTAGEEVLALDLRGRHDGRVLLDGVWTTASWLELRPPPKPPASQRSRR